MKESILTKFTNCTLLRNHRIVNEDLWIRNGRVVNPEEIFYIERIYADIVYDCNGSLIAPGFIDIQLNGGFGVDFSADIETVEAGVNKVSFELLKHGVTSFCPTMVTSGVEHYHKILPNIKRRQGGTHGATVLGVHLEGPFINFAKKGAHAEECIMDLEQGMKTAEEVYGPGLKNATIVTLAPEKVGCLGPAGAIRGLTKMGITVSLGHSSASLTDGEKGVAEGARLITHLFNAMLPFHHRDPGLIGLLTSYQQDNMIYFGIISDGVHTHPAALRIAHKTHPNGLILVSDAVPALGLPDGEHHIGPRSVTVKNGKAFLTGTDKLCGSTSALDECVQIFKRSTNCSREFALEAASLRPALALGLENKGTLSFGADADFLLLDPDTLSVRSTWIAGRCVYEKKGFQSVSIVV